MVNLMKYFAFFILCLLVVTACENTSGIVNNYIPYAEIPGDYSLENAKNDNLVVFEDGDITSGQEAWDKFIDITEQENHTLSDWLSIILWMVRVLLQHTNNMR